MAPQAEAVAADKKSRARKAAIPPSLEAIAHRRLVDRINAYRELVAKAAAGPLNEEELGDASDLLAALQLPSFAWERDVAALRQHDELVRAAAEANRQQPEHERQARQLAETIARLDSELKAARAEHYTLANVKPMERIGLQQRINELRVLHPHILADADEAARMRLEAESKRRAALNRPETFTEGWST